MEEKQSRQPVIRRPRVLTSLDSPNGVLVSCQMANGEHVLIPLQILFASFETDFVSKIRMHTNIRF